MSVFNIKPTSLQGLKGRLYLPSFLIKQGNVFRLELAVVGQERERFPVSLVRLLGLEPRTYEL